jgi:hypothetical protein
VLQNPSVNHIVSIAALQDTTHIQSIIGRAGGQWWAAIGGAASFNNVEIPLWDNIDWSDVFAADVNGDGLDDVVGLNASTGVWQVSLNQGGNVFNTVANFGTWSNTATWITVSTGDVNGDGRADIVGRQQGSGQWWVGISNGTGFTFSQFTAWSTGATWQDVHLADVTGDGRADVVGRFLGNWWVGVSNGAGFDNAQWGSWSNAVNWVDVNVGDVNGDGRSDIVGRNSATGEWTLSLSQGTSLTANTIAAVWSNTVTWTNVRLADLNNDGKADLVGLVGNNVWVGLSAGATFNTNLAGVFPSGTYVDDVVGDFNGDGLLDLAGRTNGDWEVMLNLGSGTFGTATKWTAWSNTVTWRDVQTAIV